MICIVAVFDCDIIALMQLFSLNSVPLKVLPPEWGLWLADFVVDFIDHLRKVYPVPEWDNYGNNINEFERALRWLFHDKSYNSQISHFESLIGSLAGKNVVINGMRKVEGKLPDKSRIQAHFLGDLARVYLHMDNMDLDAAIQVMKSTQVASI